MKFRRILLELGIEAFIFICMWASVHILKLKPEWLGWLFSIIVTIFIGVGMPTEKINN